MDHPKQGRKFRIFFTILLLAVGATFLIITFHVPSRHLLANTVSSVRVYIPPPYKSSSNTISPINSQNTQNPIESPLEWPPERPKLEKASVVNEFESSITQPNAPDTPPWPMPLPPDVTNNKYILYECSETVCGGWSNRLYGIIGVYFIALMFDRTLSIKINRPCPLENYLEPRSIKWNVSIPLDDWTKISFDGIDGYKVPLHKLQKLETILSNNKNAVVKIHIAQTGYIALFATVKHYRQKLLDKGFTEKQLNQLSFMHFPLRYQIYDLLFKLKPYLQERKDNFFKTLENKPLICAHVRTGGGRTIPGDVARGKTSGTKQLWNFLREKLEFTKFKDAKVFLATDTDTVREEFKKEFGNRGTEISGNIVHIDRWGAQKNTFGGSKKAACEGTDKVMLDFEVMSECDLLVITWGSGFSTMPALRNRHRNELYVWRCESNKCWVESLRRVQSEFRDKVSKSLTNARYINCSNILDC